MGMLLLLSAANPQLVPKQALDSTISGPRGGRGDGISA